MKKARLEGFGHCSMNKHTLAHSVCGINCSVLAFPKLLQCDGFGVDFQEIISVFRACEALWGSFKMKGAIYTEGVSNRGCSTGWFEENKPVRRK